MKILFKYNSFYLLRCMGQCRFDIRVLFVSFVCLNPSLSYSAAGDVISNIATIDYVYQGNPLIQESSPAGNTVTGAGNGLATSFSEDRLINFSVISTDAAAVNVSSFQSGAFLSFTLTNNGNDVQDFLLTAINTSSPFVANTDNYDPVSPLQVFLEDGSNAGYLLAEDTAVFVDDLAAGASATIYVVATMPAANVGDAAAVALVAQVAEGGIAGQGAVISNDDNGYISPAGSYSNGAVNVVAGTANTVINTSGLETVFNDPAGINVEDVDTASVQDVRANGQHSDVGLFYVQTAAAADVVLNKSVTVIDTLGGTDPHAGATLRYQIDVVVGGVSNIDDLVISDVIPPNTTYVSSSLFLNGVLQTDLADAPTDYSIFNGSSIVVDLSQNGAVSIVPGTPNQITFDVTID